LNSVLFHPQLSNWVMLNRTGYEIAELLSTGASTVEAAERFASIYDLSLETAMEDVASMKNHLREHHFFYGQHHQQKQLIRKPHLQSIFFHLTDRCNLLCPHCYIADSEQKAPEDFPIDKALELIDALTGTEGGSITLSGGEPLLYPDIRAIINYAARKVAVELLTNGTLIDQKWAAFLAKKNVSVQVSIDGASAKTHDALRGKHSFARTLLAIRYLQEAGLGKRITVSTTIMEQNIRELKDIICLAQRLKVPYLRFLPVRNTGRCKQQWDKIGAGLGIKDYEKIFQYVIELQANHQPGIDISCGVSGFLLKIPQSSRGADKGDDIWCPIGKRMVVDTKGDAWPCVLMMRKKFKLGNVFVETPQKIMQSKVMKSVCRALSSRRKKIEKCRACTFQNLCQAGCMGQALDHTDTIWDTDAFCLFRQKAYAFAFNKILTLEDRKGQYLHTY